MDFTTYSEDELKSCLYKTAYEAKVKDFSEDDINKLYEEAYKRKVFRLDVILNMHHWSLYFLKKVTKPHYRVDSSGCYWVRAN